MPATSVLRAVLVMLVVGMVVTILLDQNPGPAGWWVP